MLRVAAGSSTFGEVSLAATSAADPPARRSVSAPTWVDSAVALLALALTLTLLDRAGADRALDPLGVALAVLSCLPLLAHQRAPLSAFAASGAVSAVLSGLGYALGPPLAATAGLFYLAADARTPGRLRNITTTVILSFAAIAGLTTVAHPVLYGVVLWGAAWIGGDQVRQRRRHVADLEERARHGERERARERRLAAAEERMRIARDLHDSAAHAINVILVQAGAARLLQESDPAATRTALATIEDVARETIGEIDHLVRGLREHDASERAVEPPPGLAALETLLSRLGVAGLTVELRVEGSPRPLSPSLDQAAYRIVQESLTNAARHGDGAVQVEIVYGERSLLVKVVNPSAQGRDDGPPAAERGHGLVGMRERATLLGGSLELAQPDGLFIVRACLPYVARESDW